MTHRLFVFASTATIIWVYTYYWSVYLSAVTIYWADPSRWEVSNKDVQLPKLGFSYVYPDDDTLGYSQKFVRPFISSSERNSLLTTSKLTVDATLQHPTQTSIVHSFPHRILPGITFNRIVEELSPDWVAQVTVEFSQHCLERDEYGDNQCHYDWGETLSMVVTACNITTPLTDVLLIHGVFKIDLVLDWEFTCKVCGEDCILSLPVTNEQLIIHMPLCPLDNQSVPRHVQVKLDDESPTKGIATRIHGHVYVGDVNMDHVIADVEVSILLK